MEWRYRNGARDNGRRKQASVKPSTDETSDNEATRRVTEALGAAVEVERSGVKMETSTTLAMGPSNASETSGRSTEASDAIAKKERGRACTLKPVTKYGADDGVAREWWSATAANQASLEAATALGSWIGNLADFADPATPQWLRVPGSSGDSGFHRESQEEVRVKKEQGDQASSESGSTTTLLNEPRSTDRQSARRTSVGGTEVDPDMDPEEKPQPPPQVPSGTPVDRDASQTKSMTRAKLKAPDLDDEDSKASSHEESEEAGWIRYHEKQLRDFLAWDPMMRLLGVKPIGEGPVAFPAPAKREGILAEMERLMQRLKEAGLVAGAFDARAIYDADPIQIHATTDMLFNRLKALVGEIRIQKSRIQVHLKLDPQDAEPSMLRARAQIQREASTQPRSQPRPKKPSTPSVDPTATASGSNMSTGRLESYFQAAMGRFLKEQGVLTPTQAPEATQNAGSQDVEMESTGLSDPDQHWKYDPDDIDFPVPARATVATTATGSTGSALIQRVRISAVSDLKEFSGKDQDEDRARAWISKVKSAFLRDQAPDEEKCLTFADLLSGSARNWYRQLPRSTRNKWSDLLRSFQTQYCGLVISVARQYYHARKRSDESPLDYLYRLNVAGLRARLKIKDADRLTLLRLPDADELEEVLRALDRAKNRQKKSANGASKFRQKAPATPAPAAPAKHVRAIQVQPDTGSEPGSSDESDSECDDYRRIYLAAAQDHAKPAEEEQKTLDRNLQDRPKQDPPSRDSRSRTHVGGPERSRCTHCGSKRHSHLACWKRLTCEKCGKKGHPGDHCLFVCCGCGELHDVGRCPKEEFYNQIRQWFNPAKHAGMLPEMAEKISDTTVEMDYDPEARQGYWKQQDPDQWFKPTEGEDTAGSRSRRVAANRRTTDPESSYLLPGESRGYWKQHSPGNWFRQAKIHGKINNEKAILVLDTGAEVSIVDTAFAQAILGMDYMMPAGIRLDLADGTLCLPDEVRIQLSGRRPLYSDKAQSVKLDRYLQLGIGESAELPMRLRGSEHDKLWVTRGDRWVPTVIKGPGKVRYLQITNIGEKELVLRQSLQVGMWLAGDRVPRIQGYVSIGSRRYMEWQNLALQATTDAGSTEAEPPEAPPGPMVERPEYPTPRAILQRRHPAQVRQVEARSKGAEDGQDGSSSDPPDQTTEGHIAGTTGIPLLQASTTAHASIQQLKVRRSPIQAVETPWEEARRHPRDGRLPGCKKPKQLRLIVHPLPIQTKLLLNARPAWIQAPIPMSNTRWDQTMDRQTKIQWTIRKVARGAGSR
ncbi:hypothetical protein PHYSODRAFT_343257 [Phytophthora sojae]|uniref:CCHC-type domain-containing protein n=1 Tax=Phytophthora sojae (strain P6497) TaxID=1094619 RepID=G5AJ49_PHYSP|nr:hypothetical protein PHYSODRAFT_335112 [Phytophthora sojae]XP_009540100.1 hypothetical protein PHYSODRAFT_343257 [Phytophthora sojae]EGZ04455.1 hypothetical protein PHYSODRAFT_343257 [Phytophthora sojae]EGZ13337.1 hypothetical protein PHYSODRAFT_335112 [Phytophthora sojae]|eukprot:XP_009530766.1 hypothetical protein PHYSODRAFT_335112 [Phytophthora sojae]